MKKTVITVAASAALIASSLAFVGCGKSETTTAGVSYKQLTDALHMVLENDRTVYTQKVVNRLVKEESVIRASEQWAEDKALPLPAQMFRMGAELTASKDAWFSYSLQSLWPINKSNAEGQTAVEKEGLQFVADNEGSAPFYGEEELGGVKYFTAVYADIAVAPVCVTCHNKHKDSPRTDFELGDVMGGVVIRIPMDGE
ncbi:MAG: Tll0287-like domain-containing protein [Opitutales bacterium]